MKKQIFSASLLIIGFLIGATALSALAAGTWTPPNNCSPTDVGCNVDAPINVATTSQSKGGNLYLGGFLSDGSRAAYSLVADSPIKARGGLVIETRATDPNPADVETGRMWLITP